MSSILLRRIKKRWITAIWVVAAIASALLLIDRSRWRNSQVEPPRLQSLVRQPGDTFSVRSPLLNLRTEYVVKWHVVPGANGRVEYQWTGILDLNPESPGVQIRSGSEQVPQVSTPEELVRSDQGFLLTLAPAPIPVAPQVRFSNEDHYPFQTVIPSASTWIGLDAKRLIRDGGKIGVHFSIGEGWSETLPIESNDWLPLLAGPISVPAGTHVLDIQVTGVRAGIRDVHLREITLIQPSTLRVSLPSSSPAPRVFVRPLHPVQSYLSGATPVAEAKIDWVDQPWKEYDEETPWIYPLQIRRLVRNAFFLPSSTEIRMKARAEKGSYLQFFPGVRNPFVPEEQVSGILRILHLTGDKRTQIWERRIEGDPLNSNALRESHLQPWQVQNSREELDQPLWREGIRIPLPDMSEGDHYLLFESTAQEGLKKPSPVFVGEPSILPPPRFKDLGTRLTQEQVIDWKGLLQKLVSSGEKDTPRPERRIWLSMAWEARVRLGRTDTALDLTDATKEILIESLNSVLVDPQFYSRDYFKTFPLPSEGEALLSATGVGDSSGSVSRLNRIVLETTFKDEILPQKQFEPVPKNRPNIILISLDTLRGDALSCLGYYRGTTPWMEEFFGTEGVRFTSANAPCSWTLPSHASLFVSQYVNRHGVVQDIQSLPPHAETLAEFLSLNGYETAAFVDRGFLHHHYGLYQGFQGYHQQGGGFEEILPESLDYLKKRDRTVPLFLFLHTFDIHDPYLPPQPFRDRFLLENMAPSRVDYAIPNADTMKAANIGLVDLTREDRDYSRALYDAQILYVDQKLKNFFAEIEKKRLLENSLVIVLSDHGEAFGEHKFWGHGWTLYEEMTHIPLLIRFPGEEYAGRVIEERVSLVDIAPTVADYLELPLAEQWQGESLLPLLQDTDSKVERRIYSQLGNNHAMYQGFLKLIEQKDPTPSRHNRDHMPAEAVFDLGKDPKERENLIDNPPMAATEEFTRLHQALSVMATQRNAEGSVEEVQLDSEQVEELQALGYLK